MRIISFSKRLRVGRIPTMSIRSLRWIIFKQEDSGEIQLSSISFLCSGNTIGPGHKLLKLRIEWRNLNSLLFEDQLTLVRLHPNLASLFNTNRAFKSQNLSLLSLYQLTSFRR